MESALQFQRAQDQPQDSEKDSGGGGLPPTGYDDWGRGGGDGDGPNYKLANEEKFAIMGQFAMRCIAFNFGYWYTDIMSESPALKIWALG